MRTGKGIVRGRPRDKGKRKAVKGVRGCRSKTYEKKTVREWSLFFLNKLGLSKNGSEVGIVNINSLYAVESGKHGDEAMG